METNHKILFQNANNLHQIKDSSIALMITSPPYPMIEMWDNMFSEQNPEIKEALNKKDGSIAFELMNQELDKVWDEVYRVLIPGGIACINIGDATRTIGENFQLFSSSTRIMNHCLKAGFSALPKILWKKTTNAPNKFMGSGMLPPGAYVTLEHEYILILRKGGKREFIKPHEKMNRQESAFFWEERNIWFTDIWEGLNGVIQKLNDEKIRCRSAAYPFELAYRLINMFSVKGDTVLDPYFGTGTTMLSAMASARNSIGVEIDQNFKDIIGERTKSIVEYANAINKKRIQQHLEFVKKRESEKGPLKYTHEKYGFKVMTRQDNSLIFDDVLSCKQTNENEFKVNYASNKEMELKSSIISSNKEIEERYNVKEYPLEIPQIEQKVERLNAPSLYNFF
ncbi:modification methylase [Candidatus Woesearchaeota archaeon CG10_big_fil_rev_8_21_14_0_10_44_13]|nr:MAG: modification methylase [Candidatus Woesearchaeota archaeon CG10_big_fil_rev_8_21_14_0_10_44_13]